MKPNQRIITMIRVFLLLIIFAITLLVDSLTLMGIIDLLAGIIFSIIAIVLSIGIAFNWSQKDNDKGEE